MSKVFISYSRTDLPQIQTLAQHLHTGGYDCWYDQDLAGGQRWWNEVLRQIVACDIFLPTISEPFLRSEACTQELNYAVTLGKPLLPIVVQQVSPRFLGPVLGQIQSIDYRTPTVDSAIQLMKALQQLPPAAPLREPLPPPPGVPASYLDTLKSRVESPYEMHRSEQVQLLADLRDRLGTDEGQDVAQLLRAFQARPDLIVSIRQDVDELLRRLPALSRPGRPPVRSASASGSGLSAMKLAIGCVATIGAVVVLLFVAGIVIALSQSNGGSQPLSGPTCYTYAGPTCPLPRGGPVNVSCTCSDGVRTYSGIAR